MHSGRWNEGVRALYTASSVDLAFTERIKQFGSTTIHLLVGMADATIARALDLTDTAVLAALGLHAADLMTDDYRVTHRLGTAFLHARIRGLVVPAAIGATARLYPQFRLVRDGVSEIRATSTTGTNVVFFGSNHRGGNHWSERRGEGFECDIAGIPRVESPG